MTDFERGQTALAVLMLGIIIAVVVAAVFV